MIILFFSPIFQITTSLVPLHNALLPPLVDTNVLPPFQPLVTLNILTLSLCLSTVNHNLHNFNINSLSTNNTCLISTPKKTLKLSVVILFILPHHLPIFLQSNFLKLKLTTFLQRINNINSPWTSPLMPSRKIKISFLLWDMLLFLVPKLFRRPSLGQLTYYSST